MNPKHPITRVRLLHHVVLTGGGFPPTPLVRRTRDGYVPLVYVRRDAADRAAGRWNAEHPNVLARVDSRPTVETRTAERKEGR